MYEVFIENKSLIISEFLSEKENYLFLKINKADIKWEEDLIKQIYENISSTNIHVHYKNPEHLFKILFKDHKRINAAGGIVEWNSQYLFIKRNGFWDIPKGKCEKKETIEESALREVKEECEISDLKIENFICTTLHTYNLNNKRFIKKTYWYKMSHYGLGNISPQSNEGITECKWFSKDEINLIKENTFKSIKYVLSKNEL